MEAKDVRINYAAARINAALSLDDVSNALKISEKTLRNYESGKTVPTWETHTRLSELYKIPVEMLCPPTKTFIMPDDNH